MNWFPLKQHSHFSLLNALSKPEQIAARLEECGYEGSALTDYGTLAGLPSFARELQEKKKKAIFGCEFYLKEGGRVSVLAKGEAGWKGLIRACSFSNRPENFDGRPKASLRELAEFAQGEWIVYAGALGSELGNSIFTHLTGAYGPLPPLIDNVQAHLLAKIAQYQQLFGVENFYLEIQLMDVGAVLASHLLADFLRSASEKSGTPKIATANSHYAKKEDSTDHRVLLCSYLKSTMKEVGKKPLKEEELHLGNFFKCNSYYIPDLEELRQLHTEDELANTVEIAKRCETPKINRPPLLPPYPCPEGRSPDDYLRELCREGWKKKIIGKIPKKKHQEYAERVKEELKVLTEFGLSSYFLIVNDYCGYARETLKMKVGKGRGSGAGCLVGYLIGITGVDPVRYQLLFERFINAGRMSKDRISLPDYDTDFPANRREEIIDYIREKYGAERVGQMATFSRLQGRGAIKEVLRVHERCSFEEMNRITEFIPDEAAIADELQDMLDAGENPSILMWALENRPEKLREWCFINEVGDLDGDYALDFAQAIRLEGTKRNQSKHASGVILCSEPLADLFPMIYDKSTKQPIVGVDMRDAESLGAVKLDLLGVTVLSRISAAEQIIRTGRMSEARV